MGGLRAGGIVLALALAMSMWVGPVAAEAPALDAYGAAPLSTMWSFCPAAI